MDLFIGTKKYSSWSLRPWSLLKEVKIPFNEHLIPFSAVLGSRRFDDTFVKAAASIGPTARVPILHHQNRVIWESLAICNYVSEQYPDARLWPEMIEKRAYAFCIATELQSELKALREALPFWCTQKLMPKVLSGDALGDLIRLKCMIEQALDMSGGPFLLGNYSVADAMALPMMSRLETYGLDLGLSVSSYRDFVLSRSAYQEWKRGAMAETTVLFELERVARIGCSSKEGRLKLPQQPFYS